jgi:hypothetical protein
MYKAAKGNFGGFVICPDFEASLLSGVIRRGTQAKRAMRIAHKIDEYPGFTLSFWRWIMSIMRGPRNSPGCSVNEVNETSLAIASMSFAPITNAS